MKRAGIVTRPADESWYHGTHLHESEKFSRGVRNARREAVQSPILSPYARARSGQRDEQYRREDSGKRHGIRGRTNGGEDSDQEELGAST
jgi:hypothetical protein